MPKNLLLIIPTFPSPNKTNTYMVPFIQQFIAGFKTHHPNVKLTIYTLYGDKNNYLWNNISVIPLNCKKGNLIIKLFCFLKSIFVLIRQILKNETSGILSFWYSETAIIANIVSFITSIPHYSWLQGQDVKRSNKYMRYFPPKPDNLIALSKFQNDYLYKEFGFYASTVNYISINPSFFPEINSSYRKIDIIGIGSFIPLKNFKLFLEVILKLKNTYTNINVALIGNGSQENELKTFCIENNLEKNVSFLGLLSHKETLNNMNNAKILLHTSSFEGGSAVIHEALFLGCQVIGRIPLIEQKKIPFYCCNSLNEITKKVITLLQKQQPIKQHIPQRQVDSTKKIYNLFFN